MKKIICILIILLLLSVPEYSSGQKNAQFITMFSLNPYGNFEKHSIRTIIDYKKGIDTYIGIIKHPSRSGELNRTGIKIKRSLSDDCIIIDIKKEPASLLQAYFTSLFPANDLWKLSPSLFDTYQAKKGFDKTGEYLIQVEDLSKIKEPVKIYNEYGILQIKLTDEKLNQWLHDDNVDYIQKSSSNPKTELAVNGFDNSVNKINLVHHSWPEINGYNTTISIKENLFDTADIDFKNRIIKTPVSSSIIAAHASYMASIIGGGGNTFYTGKGAAWNTSLASSDFANLMPDNSTIFRQNNIAVQNHSYGTITENFYGAEAAAYDAQANANPSLLHIFSVGNKGTDAGTQSYAGVNGFANTTGNFKMAKNVITVGHIDSFGVVLPLSSRGPAYDGRVKPELVAYAEDGSSGAAAIVSGISLLVQQAYKDMNGVLPPSALVKAVLFNSAEDVEAKAIDYKSGYGSVNAFKAINTIKENRMLSGSVTNGSQINFTVTIPANAINFKVTLVWNDPAAQVNSFKALVNDLDLQLKHNSSNTIYQPWVLNSAANVAALNELAVRARDSLNNTEQITIDAPASGNYTISVNGYNIPSGTQSFYIAYQWDTLNSFHWNYPTGSDNIFSGSNNLLRWDNSYNTTGKLEYSTNNGLSWNSISNNIDLSKQNLYWQAPDTFCTGLLRMTTGTDIYVSDTFSISNLITTGVGFNCTDSAMIYWKKIKGLNSYQVYKLGNQYLKPFTLTTDTFLVIKKNVSPALHYTVAPVLSFAKQGLKNYTFNYTTQGVDCYFRNMLVDLIDKSARVQLFMGTEYNVKSLCIEKLNSGNYSCIKTFSPNGTLTYSYDDNALVKGGNTYRVKIELTNGQIVTGDETTIYYFDNSEYLVFPNPTKRENGFTILSSSLEPSVIQLYTTAGKLVLQKQLNSFSEKINTASLQKGLYFYLLLKDNKKVVHGKLIIQ